MDAITDFSTKRGLVLDPFQEEACTAIAQGYSVLVAAPTGSGKTAIADFAAYSDMQANTRLIYTTPIKALSNQKYAEFCELYGSDNVGLATGDRSILPRARITVMTTEVLRNMIYTDPDALDDVSHVVLDEVHYISDRSRGAVWEEVIIQLPLSVDLICLSATVSNAEDVAQWLTTVRGSTRAIIHETRPVPLTYWFSFRKKGQSMNVLPLLSHSDKESSSAHPDLYRAMHARNPRGRTPVILAPRRLELIEYLNSNGMLPAIFFIFSRAGCDDAVHDCYNSHMNLTDSHERQQIRDILDRHLGEVSDDDFSALDYHIVTHAMERGFAPHHAGLIPPLREAVEEAFVRGLVKVVFATETLAVGVNMPAKSVVIEKLTKYNGEGHDVLTPGEFTQLTGRAGRRGIDVAGHAFVQWNRFVDFEQAASLASTRTYALRSSFRPTYNMATNLIRSYSPTHARHILNLSFAQFQADAAVVTLERTLETKARRAEHIRSLFSMTDRQFSALVHKHKTKPAKKKSVDKKFSSRDFLRSLHLGDILDNIAHLEPCAVVMKASPRAEPFVRLIDVHGRTHTLTSDQVTSAAEKIAHMDLPTPIAPRTKHFRVATSIALRSAMKNISRQWPKKVATDKATSQDDMLDEYVANTHDVTRLTRRVQARGQSLARQFERILALLTEYGYVDEWTLTDKGEILSQINAEADLVIAEHIALGSLRELSVPEFVGLLSTFIFESRGDDYPSMTNFSRGKIADVIDSCQRYIADLNADERDAGLRESRLMDFTMFYPAYRWAQGKSLDSILMESEIAGGDFVRAIKSVIDLIRQIENASEDPLLRELCANAHHACFRDIIEISS